MDTFNVEYINIVETFTNFKKNMMPFINIMKNSIVFYIIIVLYIILYGLRK